MAAPKGHKQYGGRKKGTPNKVTAIAREAIARFVDYNTPRMQGWLDEIAADDDLGPMAAFNCVKDLLEYHIPKLGRTEHTGEDGKPIETLVRIGYIAPKEPGGSGT